MPWLRCLDGTTCAVPLKGRFKEAFFTAPVGQKPCGQWFWATKRNFARYLGHGGRRHQSPAARREAGHLACCAGIELLTGRQRSATGNRGCPILAHRGPV